MAPPWVLDYVKMSLEHLAQEALKKAIRGALDPPESPFAKEYREGDRATVDQVNQTIQVLKDKEKFQEVYIAPNVAYYSQADSRWADDPYPMKGRPEDLPPSSRHIGPSGCAPSSLAIAYSTLWGTKTTPPEVAAFAVKEGFSSAHEYPAKEAGGTDMGLIKAWAKEHHTDVKTTKDIGELRDGLLHGGVAVVQVHGGIFNIDKHGNPAQRSHGHVIAVTGYAKDEHGDEWFFVANPGMDGRAKTYADELAKEGMVVNKDFKHQGAGMVRVRAEVLEEYLKGKGAYVLSKGA